MDGFSLKRRAVAFAICAGAVAFILALLGTSGGRLDGVTAAQALIPAIVCAAMCWAHAERTIAQTAGAIDAAIERMARAANGDLQAPIPPEVGECVPPLAHAMAGLFQQTHTHLETVQRLALFDPVTGLANRTHFRQMAARALTARPPATLAAVLFVDLDRFKRVNDTLGHAVGDQLLAAVANRLRMVGERFAAADDPPSIIGRLAGDEFTLLFPSLAGVADAERIGNAILHALSEPFDVADHALTIGASIGVSFAPTHGSTLTELMRAADAAMYQAKGAGRGRVALFSDALAAEIVGRTRLEGELRTAIEQDQFALVFQPQVGIASGRIVAAEALLRWHHPSGELRLPGEFIARAEETGLIVEIGEWVSTGVAATIARWSRLGVEQRLAINISRRQLDHAQFFRHLRAAMQAAHAPARLLELEITETLAMRCSDEVVEAIAALRADGATIAIDDFGTGYSNLRRLRDLPVDRVKLDRSLIGGIVEHEHVRTIVAAVIGLVHGLGYEAVAQGIESDAQLGVLRAAGCDVIQGYGVAPPMNEATFLDWARRITPAEARA